MPEEISQLISALSDPEPRIRSDAAEELSRIGADAQEATVPLVRACGDESEEVREWAVAALEELGAPSPADVGALASVLEDSSAEVCYWSATLLGRLGDDASAGIPSLIRALSNHVAIAVRERAAWALGRIGPKAISALNTLQTAAEGDAVRLARLARKAIEQINT